MSTDSIGTLAAFGDPTDLVERESEAIESTRRLLLASEQYLHAQQQELTARQQTLDAERDRLSRRRAELVAQESSLGVLRVSLAHSWMGERIAMHNAAAREDSLLLPLKPKAAK